LLDKIAKIKYSDDIMYSDSQDFSWSNLEDWTSYSSSDSNIDILVCKYKKYLYSKRYTEPNSDESQSSYWDPDMDIVFRYMRGLPRRIRKIVNLKIVCPEISSTELAKRLAINRDTLYQDYQRIRRAFPELIYFCCPKYRNEAK